jgi:hypothetical protein
MKQISLLFIPVVLLFAACSQDKKSDCITLNLEKAIRSTKSNLILNDISSGYRVIPLETSDSCLLSYPFIKYVTDSDIWIKDSQAIYRFDKINGRLLFKLDRKGQGTEEYLSTLDYVIDYSTQTILIYDINKKRIITYNFEGKYLNSFKNDFISSFELTGENRFLVSYTPYSEEPFHIGIYDRSWNVINQLMPKTEVFNQKKGLFHYDGLYKFNDRHYLKKTFGDTVYQVDTQSAKLYVAVSKGNLKIPVHIATDLSKKKEVPLYISGEFGYIVSSYYFSTYYYQDNTYQDVWNLETSSLVYRNLRHGPDSNNGIPFIIQGNTIFVWPKCVCNEYMYCTVPADEMKKIIPEMKDDDNPVILEIKIAKNEL